MSFTCFCCQHLLRSLVVTYIEILHFVFETRFSIPIYTARTGLLGYRYVDRSLPGGTTKIDRRWLIEGEKEKKKKMKIRKKKEEEKKKEYLASSSPTCHRRPRAAVALARDFSPARGERSRRRQEAIWKKVFKVV
ncbi:hypothetical protein BHM03_00051479 [Ensete ventricosum]|nr:hypothetical protein BHM03_00051479 [Ensete ventricosum]